ncbi:hypothetical protein T484DRAFT_2542226 [Baffinella frigidus]|nr:hypothetical protein T484DRAFT_2542226 [Cryptophyta sp. CCMP2293]
MLQATFGRTARERSFFCRLALRRACLQCTRRGVSLLSELPRVQPMQLASGVSVSQTPAHCLCPECACARSCATPPLPHLLRTDTPESRRSADWAVGRNVTSTPECIAGACISQSRTPPKTPESRSTSGQSRGTCSTTTGGPAANAPRTGRCPRSHLPGSSRSASAATTPNVGWTEARANGASSKAGRSRRMGWMRRRAGAPRGGRWRWQRR